MVEVAQHPNIKLYTYAELEHLDGFIGNFKATIRLKAKSVDEKICTGCGLCTTKCPQKRISSEFNAGLGLRTAIYVPFPQAVPNKPVIDKKHCNYYKRGKCKICEKTCPTGAICFDKEDEFVTEDIGAVVVATGFNVLGTEFFPEYGYGRYKDVITGLQFERLASASGPTSGEIRRPSDGTMPKKIVFIACAGSRDPVKGILYCSKICCMYTAKHAMLYQHKVHGGESYVFYMDIRAAGKNYEEFVRRAIEDDGVNYVRGRVARVYEKDGKLIVKGVDTLMGAKVAALFSSDKLVREPLIAVVNRMAPPVYSTCVGCFMCQTACPYQAIEREEIKDRGGNVVKTVARVNPGLCQGCGTCVAFCRSKSIDIQGYSNDQMYAEVMALLHTQGA